MSVASVGGLSGWCIEVCLPAVSAQTQCLPDWTGLISSTYPARPCRNTTAVLGIRKQQHFTCRELHVELRVP